MTGIQLRFDQCAECAPWVRDMLQRSNARGRLRDSESEARRLVKLRRLRFPYETEEEARSNLPESLSQAMSEEVVELAEILVPLFKGSRESEIQNVHVSFLYVEDFNAFAMPLGSGHVLCVLNSLLALTQNQMNAALIDYCVNTRFSQAGEKAGNDLLLFSLSVLHLLGESRESEIAELFATHYVNDPVKHLVCETMAVVQIAFVLCHELAHHFLGHTSTVKEARIFPDDAAQQPIYSRSQQSEFEADAVALQVVQRYIQRFSRSDMETHKWGVPSLTLIGPILLMLYIECLEEANGGWRGRRRRSATHPPTLERRRRLLDMLRSNLEEEHLEFLKGVNHFLFTAIPKVAKRDGQSVIREPLDLQL